MSLASLRRLRHLPRLWSFGLLPLLALWLLWLLFLISLHARAEQQLLDTEATGFVPTGFGPISPIFLSWCLAAFFVWRFPPGPQAFWRTRPLSASLVLFAHATLLLGLFVAPAVGLGHRFFLAAGFPPELSLGFGIDGAWIYGSQVLAAASVAALVRSPSRFFLASIALGFGCMLVERVTSLLLVPRHSSEWVFLAVPVATICLAWAYRWPGDRRLPWMAAASVVLGFPLLALATARSDPPPPPREEIALPSTLPDGTHLPELYLEGPRGRRKPELESFARVYLAAEGRLPKEPAELDLVGRILESRFQIEGGPEWSASYDHEPERLFFSPLSPHARVRKPELWTASRSMMTLEREEAEGFWARPGTFRLRVRLIAFREKSLGRLALEPGSRLRYRNGYFRLKGVHRASGQLFLRVERHESRRIWQLSSPYQPKIRAEVEGWIDERGAPDDLVDRRARPPWKSGFPSVDLPVHGSSFFARSRFPRQGPIDSRLVPDPGVHGTPTDPSHVELIARVPVASEVRELVLEEVTLQGLSEYLWRDRDYLDRTAELPPAGRVGGFDLGGGS
ncbi:MAG: hypothetical protein MI919_25125 [Holophagales bacterium]|nr:hypothetical protein [Holophagales bacterium]